MRTVKVNILMRSKNLNLESLFLRIQKIPRPHNQTDPTPITNTRVHIIMHYLRVSESIIA